MKTSFRSNLLIAFLIVSILTGCSMSTPDETTAPEITTEATTEVTESAAEEVTTAPAETTAPAPATEDPSQNTTAPETTPTTVPTELTEPPHTHDYQVKVTKPTCESKGYTTYTCSCGEEYRSDETDAIGHNYKTKTIAPTTESKGYDLHKCKFCDKSYKDNYTDKLPPETKPAETEPPTAAPLPTEPAYTKHTHEWKTETLKATCTTGGYDIVTCSCGEEYTENHVSATGHDMQAETVIAPTTEVQGYTVYKCKNCNYTENRDYTDKLPVETVPETTVHEHTWTEWKWTGDNNYYGEYIRTCTVCNETDHPDTSSSYAVPEVVTIINEYRSAEGLSPLTYDSSGQDIANLRAAELRCEFCHHSGSFCDNGFYKGECIASGQRSAQSVVDAWMESSSHRPSLMNPDATKAVVARNGNCWVIAFG